MYFENSWVGDALRAQYAANEAEAEAGGTDPEQRWRFETARDAENAPTSSDLYADGPFGHYCADNAPIWKLYMDQAKISDDNLANTFNSDLDPLLIFAGLFSAILSAFLIEIRKGLQEDLQTITNTLLTVLIENQRNATPALAPTAPAFAPSSSSRWVNGLWFSSLMFSLMSALGASLAKGWITQFSSSVSGSTWADASLHCQRFGGLRRWHLKLIIECLPILIHIAFFLFSIGLVILLVQDDLAIGIVLCAMTGVILVLYAGSSVHPAFSSDSPFRTPVSGMVRRLMNGPLRLEGFAPFPSRTDVQKARALSWMLTESSNPDITNNVFRAIAGLPANPAVQDELYRGGSLPLLLRLILVELGRSSPDTDSLRSWLYALFHFVQTAPVDPEDSAVTASLKDLVKPGGALGDTSVLPLSILAIALCVKGRIILLLFPDIMDATLFETDIPVMAQTCDDAHLQRLFTEIHTLWRVFPEMQLGVLGATKAINRNEVHVEVVKQAGLVVKQAGLVHYFADSVANFGAAALLNGLLSESTQLQLQCAGLLADLARHSTFRRQFANILSSTDLFAIIAIEHKLARSLILSILTIMTRDNRCLDAILNCLPGALQLLNNESGDKVHIVSEITSLVEAVIYRGQDRAHHYAYWDGKKENRIGVLGIECWETTMEILRTLGVRNSMVRRWALETAIALVQHDEGHTSVSFNGMVSGVVSLVRHEDPPVQQSALGVITALTHYTQQIPLSRTGSALISTQDALCASISDDIISRVLSMLDNDDGQMVICALDACIALVRYDDIRHSICSSGMVSKIVALLDPSKSYISKSPGPWGEIVALATPVRCSALDAVRIFLNHVDVPVSIFPGESVSKLLSMLEDPYLKIQQTALDTIANVLSFEHVREYVGASQTISQVVSKLRYASWDAQVCLLDTLKALMEYNDLRAPVCAGEGVADVLSMMEVVDSDVRRTGLDALVVILPYDDVCASVWAAKVVSRLINMLEDEATAVCDRAFATFTALLPHDETRRLMFGDDAIYKIMAGLKHPEWVMRRQALRAITAIGQYTDVRKSVCSGETFSRILFMLENDEDFDDQTALCDSQDSLPSDDGRPCAFNAAIALLWSDDARTSLSGMVVSKIIVMLEDEQHIIRQLDALSAIATSVQYPDIREAICSRSKSENSTSIIYNTLSLLRHENADIRRNAYDVVLALVVYDDSHALLFSGETFFEVASLLRDDSLPSMYELRSHHDCDTFICEMIPAVVSKLQDGPGTKTLAALILIMQTAQGGEAISPDLMSQIGSLLADPKWRIERHTLRCFIDLMQYDKLRPYFPFSQTAARILPLLRSARWTEIEGLLTYLSYDDDQNAPLRVEEIIRFIGRVWEGDPYVQLMQGIIRRNALHSYLALLGTALCNRLFPLLQHSPNRDSYTELILALPSSFDIPTDDRETLMDILADPDNHGLQCGVKIVTHFAPNDQFRGEILRSNILSISLELLRTRDTAPMAVELITEFSRYGDMRGPLLHPTTGIVQELLMMMKSDTDDIDRWGPGLKGLMALDLFAHARDRFAPTLRFPRLVCDPAAHYDYDEDTDIPSFRIE